MYLLDLWTFFAMDNAVLAESWVREKPKQWCCCCCPPGLDAPLRRGIRHHYRLLLLSYVSLLFSETGKVW